MIQIFKDVRIDWLANRRAFIAVSVLLMLVGLASAVIRQTTGRQAFNLGVDFKGGTEIIFAFKDADSGQFVKVDPATLKFQELVRNPDIQGFGVTTVAIQIGKELWLGSVRGDRIAIFPLPQ